jgi:hypothetical protein
MSNLVLTLVALAALIVAAVSSMLPAVAGAQSPCDLGFALTNGGIQDADVNGDGLTCEFNTIDSITGVWTTLALDNAPPRAGDVVGTCPDGFLPSPAPMPGSSPDRNGNGVVCTKAFCPGNPAAECRGVKIIIIDDVASGGGGSK